MSFFTTTYSLADYLMDGAPSKTSRKRRNDMKLSDTVVMNDGTLGTITVDNLKAGDAGVYQTIAEMKRLVLRDAKNPKVIKLASSLKGDNDIATIYNIYTHVWKNFKYKSDPDDSEFVTAPIHIINDNSPYDYNDCDDLSSVLACLLLAANSGFRPSFKTIAWRKHAYTHVYCECYVPSLKGDIPLDPVMKEKGFGNERPKVIRKKVFPITQQGTEYL